MHMEDKDGYKRGGVLWDVHLVGYAQEASAVH